MTMLIFIFVGCSNEQVEGERSIEEISEQEETVKEEETNLDQ